MDGFFFKFFCFSGFSSKSEKMEKWKEGLSHDTALNLIGFLGGTESNEASDRCLYHALRKKDKEMTLELERDGAETFENVVSKETCERLCESCDEILSETLKMEESSRKSLLDDIKSPNKRCSLSCLKMPMIKRYTKCAECSTLF